MQDWKNWKVKSSKQVRGRLKRLRKSSSTQKVKNYNAKKERLIQKIARAKDSKANVVKAICKDFNSNMSSFFSVALMSRALELLSDRDFTGKDIPYMHAKTIEYLLNQKVCICGTHLDEGSVPYTKVKALIDFLPPSVPSAI